METSPPDGLHLQHVASLVHSLLQHVLLLWLLGSGSDCVHNDNGHKNDFASLHIPGREEEELGAFE